MSLHYILRKTVRISFLNQLNPKHIERNIFIFVWKCEISNDLECYFFLILLIVRSIEAPKRKSKLKLSEICGKVSGNQNKNNQIKDYEGEKYLKVSFEVIFDEIYGYSA